MRYVIGPKDVQPIQLVGREMRRLINAETVEAQHLSVVIIWVPPGAEVLPCHSHKAEEVAYIVRGEGEYWVDGHKGRFKADEIVWFPYGCKHMIRNTGRETMEAVCMYSPPMSPDQYTLYEEITFASVD
jgi:mannose-6-phosphate isomerase-like protein (cupin superfamily)